MENGTLKEVSLVKKGLFYYIVKIVIFPFKIAYIGFRYVVLLSIGELKQYNEIMESKKRAEKLNRMINKDKVTEVL